MPTGHPSSRNRRDLLYHLLVHLHLSTKVSTIVRISEPSLRILRVVWCKGVVSLMHALSLVETTRVHLPDRAHLEGLLLVLTEDQTAYMLSQVAKSKMICLMLLLV
ncbi:hypothetical protein MTR67_043248 [Solanum verrucosum]|uniref:Uncharacterized protein n=1 Tax=Solanum verrucosum TaxID=315347 RepID=A0AAF0ZU42_SOLVR|nr:hypothetical protein MTR67_043248 [Solanum verrucosum]